MMNSQAKRLMLLGIIVFFGSKFILLLVLDRLALLVPARVDGGADVLRT